MTDSGGTHLLSSTRYTLHDLRRLVDERPRLALAPDVRAQIEAGARYVQARATEDRYIYGVNTGYGALCETRIGVEHLEELQRRHVLSHACGVGPIVPERISRLVMLVKLLTFRTGHTGISVETVDRLLAHWNEGLIPTIPKRGTVGASGDLAPLAHMALPLLGLGQVYMDGRVVPASEALARTGWAPLRLRAKEGLALTNGVQYINALAASALMEIGDLVRCADVIASLSVQGFSAARLFYHPRYHETSFHEDRRIVAANLGALLDGSNHSELPTCNRSTQDPYSFRCIPQVHGAIRQTLRFTWQVMEDECNGVSDNPLFFPEEDLILTGGNLHGESTAFSTDFLAIAVSELANISERRTWQLLSGQRGLPSFLVANPGLDSGLMVVQYTSAALVNECKVLSTPASVDTIPTCQTQEDSVSMGGTSAYKLGQIVENCGTVLAIELLVAAQACDLNGGLRLSPTTQAIVDGLRQRVPFLSEDRLLADDIEATRTFFAEHARAWSTLVA
jgi:histidine ammonia-lyase